MMASALTEFRFPVIEVGCCTRAQYALSMKKQNCTIFEKTTYQWQQPYRSTEFIFRLVPIIPLAAVSTGGRIISTVLEDSPPLLVDIVRFQTNMFFIDTHLIVAQMRRLKVSWGTTVLSWHMAINLYTPITLLGSNSPPNLTLIIPYPLEVLAPSHIWQSLSPALCTLDNSCLPFIKAIHSRLIIIFE